MASHAEALLQDYNQKVQEGRKLLAEQREHVREMQEQGQNSRMAEDALHAFERAVEELEDCVQVLEATIKKSN